MKDQEHSQLNSWIAEHVTRRGTGHYYCSGCRQCVPIEEVTSGGYHENCQIGGKIDNGIPHYTTSPADALEVLKKCAEKCEKDCKLIGIRRAEVWTVFARDHYDRETAEAETIELAICLFAKQLFSK